MRVCQAASTPIATRGPATVAQMRPVDPPRPVQVQRDDTWHAGWLHAWRRDRDGWRAFVRYSVGVGAQHVEWVDAARLVAA